MPRILVCDGNTGIHTNVRNAIRRAAYDYDVGVFPNAREGLRWATGADISPLSRLTIDSMVHALQTAGEERFSQLALVLTSGVLVDPVIAEGQSIGGNQLAEVLRVSGCLARIFCYNPRGLTPGRDGRFYFDRRFDVQDEGWSCLVNAVAQEFGRCKPLMRENILEAVNVYYHAAHDTYRIAPPRIVEQEITKVMGDLERNGQSELELGTAEDETAKMCWALGKDKRFPGTDYTITAISPKLDLLRSVRNGIEKQQLIVQRQTKITEELKVAGFPAYANLD